MFGRVDLQLTEEEWSRLNLKEFSLLAKRHSALKEQECYLADHRAAMIAASIHNSTISIVSTLAGKKAGSPKKISDFMPKKKTKKTWQEMKAIAQAWVATLKGGV